MSETKKPEWAPENAGREYASRVVSGVENTSISSDRHSTLRKRYDLQEIKQGILKGNRTLLSKAITLVESNSQKHFEHAQLLIKELLPHSGKSLRIGITGTPGAGKSTFIESFGLWLIERGHKVAVLAIDPSSTISKGSILGDKTRMESLSRSEGSFIRPSPSGGVLGGVARKTRETIILCEAAGYDIVLVETVGVGQSETTVRSMVDFFVLMQISGAGDDLQGIKKGIMELADLILINKADGENVLKASTAAGELNNVLHYLQHATQGWQTSAITCSALQKIGLDEVWEKISDFLKHVKEKGIFEQRRKQQDLNWFEDMLLEALRQEFFSVPGILDSYTRIKDHIASAATSPSAAVADLINIFRNRDQDPSLI